jgi:hypothetical protein
LSVSAECHEDQPAMALHHGRLPMNPLSNEARAVNAREGQAQRPAGRGMRRDRQKCGIVNIDEIFSIESAGTS